MVRRSYSIFSIVLLFFLIACSQNNEQQAVDKNNQTEQKDSENSEGKKDSLSSDDNNSQNNAETLDMSNKTVEGLPDTYKALTSKRAGPHQELYKYTDEAKRLEFYQDKLPILPENPSNKQLDYFYQEILKLIQRDFNGPDKLIDNMRFQSLGSPDVEDSRYQFKENLNIEIILDASGSMDEDVSGQTKMEAAKETIQSFVQGLPEKAKVGIRVYGHKGSESEADKQKSCKSTELIYQISEIDQKKLSQTLKGVEPTGWTPITKAFQEAEKDLKDFNGDRNTNIVYLVSDGIATCEGDPIQAAKDLYSSEVTPIINVIGFQVDQKGQKQLENIADTTKGIYETVENPNQLKKEFDKVKEVAQSWEDWKDHSETKISVKDTENSLDIFGYITDEEGKIIDERMQAESIFSAYWMEGTMSKESYQYLEEKNHAYHDWIVKEVKELKSELNNIREKKHQEALKALEEKYKNNTKE
ncbi:VWA domain-containing protein [Pontibacillus yanchengensis]|uniref:VWA domain-containing protein n=1 Tax=Pontibacillus yanchengensis TaxID=462910 RepID=A0ACC7VLN6_9BACI|nr:VWA domain-containing protein [Pontibacillus yanchengensis]MYL55712.1 VWA domain-containing protein [Pontibacillus yanchengensis]